MVDLPAPDLADQPQHLALFQRHRHALDDLDLLGRLAGRIGRGADLQAAHLQEVLAHPRPPFRLVVRPRIQSATRLTEIASVAIAIAG
jgi:hypothetical protein